MESKFFASLDPPPFPESTASSNSSKKKDDEFPSPPLHEGKQFLNLLKTLENLAKSIESSTEEDNKDQVEAFSSTQEEILDILSTMENLFQRRGLLEYDSERAHEIQGKMNDKHSSLQGNDGGTAAAKGSNGKKRKRSGAGGGSNGNIASILGIDAGNSNGSIGKEAYVLSNLCRILMPTSTSSSKNQDRELVQKYPPIIIAAASNAFTAICEHGLNHLPSLTATVEHSMIISISPQVISGIAKTVQLLLSGMKRIELGHQECMQFEKALASSCNCLSILISISGIRLSRSVKIMENVLNAAEGITWRDQRAENISFTAANEAAATLISTIPFAGNTNGDSPSKIWTEQLLSSCKTLLTTLIAFYPVSKRLRGKQERKRNSSNNETIEWIEHIRSTAPSQASRIQVFSMRLEGYITIITKFLNMDRHNQMEASICCSLPIKRLLDVVENMFSFCTNAESKFLSTKPRLRNVSVDGGLLSPNAAITVANHVKFHANNLLQNICSLLSNSALIHGTRVIEIVLSNLQSSSTYTLRSIVDPLSVADKNSKRKWLHSSISLRTMSVQSMLCIIQKLGSSSVVSEPESIAKSIFFIVGMLVEQISDDCGDIEQGVEREHWGTFEERSKLVETCIDTLASYVSICGGFLPNNSREVIESVAKTCFDQLCSEVFGSIYCNNVTTKVSILKLGINCITSPWSDGSASSMVGTVKKTSIFLKCDRNTLVSSTAYTALSICNCLAIQRSPPLVIISRDKNVDAFQEAGMTTDFSKSLIEEGIKSVKERITTMKQNQIKEAQSKATKEKAQSNEVEDQSKEVQGDVTTVQSGKSKMANGNDAKAKITDMEQNESLSQGTPTTASFPGKFQQSRVDKKGNKHHNGRQMEPKMDSNEQKDQGLEVDTGRDDGERKEERDENFHKELKKPKLKDTSPAVNPSKIAAMNQDDDEDDESIGDDFPMIVDCDPDDEDVDFS